jgi:hypothetical protein
MFCTILAIITVPIVYIANKFIDHKFIDHKFTGDKFTGDKFTCHKFIDDTFVSRNSIHNKIQDKVKATVAYYGWYVLEFCSRVEIKVQQSYAYIRQYFPACNKKEEESFITLVKDGEEISKYEFSEFMTLKENIVKDQYDFILYELPMQNNSKYETYIMRYNSHEDIMKIEYNVLNEFNFNVIRFNFKGVDVTYNINFDKNQLIVNGNILFDRDFLKWYLNKYHKAIVQDEDKYTVSFIDHSMNYTILTEDTYIIIKNKGYDIVNIKTDPVSTL